VFAYINPDIRQRLLDAGKLVRLDASGQLIPPHEVSEDTDLTVNLVGPIPMPLCLNGTEVTFDWYAFVRHTELSKANELADVLRSRGDQHLFANLSSHMSVNSALVWGDLQASPRPLARVHSNCLTGDVFGSQRCECGPQLETALSRIHAHGAGALIYMAGHEGRGIGLWAKAITYMLQDSGEDTYQANRSLGLPDDSRDFRDAAAVLLYLLGGDRPFTLLSNNPKKVEDLRARGLTNFDSDKLVVGVTPNNRRYLEAKRQWGHMIEGDDLE